MNGSVNASRRASLVLIIAMTVAVNDKAFISFPIAKTSIKAPSPKPNKNNKADKAAVDNG